MEPRANQASGSGDRVDCISNHMRAGALIADPMSADGKAQRPDYQRQVHHAILERAAIVLHGAVGENRGCQDTCRAI
jgi:hypothetical protein